MTYNQMRKEYFIMDNNFLFFDIDGTLIDPKTAATPASAAKAIKSAKERGSKIFICSGRPYYELRESFGIQRDGTIFASGGGFELDGKIVLKRIFPKELVLAIIEKAEECRVGFNVLCFDHGFSNKRWHDMVYGPLLSLPVTVANRMLILPFYAVGNYPIEKFAGEEVFKINIQFFPDSDKEAFDAFIKPLVTYVPVNSQMKEATGAEISPIDVNKGNGVLMVVTHYHGDMVNAYGFGDSLNDIEMIKECGHGVVMGNGDDELKKYANYITTDVDKDGIANALKHFGLCA